MFIKHTITKNPTELRKHSILMVITTLISSAAFNGMSFLLQFGKEEIIAGNTVIGLILVTLYYVRGTLKTFYSLWKDSVQENFQEAIGIVVNNRSSSVLLKVRGKIWVRNEETHSMEIMSSNKIFNSLKNYLDELWHFKQNLPIGIITIVFTLATFIGFIWVSSIEICHTVLFIITMVISSALSLLFAVKRIHINKETRTKQREVRNQQHDLLNDILNIEPINKKHSEFMVANFLAADQKSFHYEKTGRTKIRHFNCLDDLFYSVSTITIIGIKVWEVGLSNVSIETILSIVAIMGIYSNIMNSVMQIIRGIERTMDSFNTIKTYQEDVEKILETLDSENESNLSQSKLFAIDVREFSVQYQAMNNEKPFLLKNSCNFSFKPDDIVLLIGPTGSGKSTFMKMLTNNIKFDSFKPNIKTDSFGNVSCIMHQADSKLGCNSVLSELTLGEPVNEEKLYYIFKGLHLYEEFLEKQEDIIKFLEIAKSYQFSTGQKQRLSIARLLYNLDESIQIVGFDEATNALNDAITLQTLDFIKQFCKGKLLLMATHQVNIGATVATHTLEFIPNGTYYSIKEL